MKIKVHKTLTFLFLIALIAAVWSIEKRKYIPQYSVVLYEMGLSCQNECGMDRQLRYFQRAINNHSRSKKRRYSKIISDAHYRSALIYEEQGDGARALASLMKATELDQQNVEAYYRIGLHYFREEAYGDALNYFQKSHEKGICPFDTFYYIARTYDKMKEYRKAISVYCNFVWDHPEYASEVYPRVAELYYLIDDPEELAYDLRHLRKRKKKGIDLADQLEQALEVIRVYRIEHPSKY